MDIIERDRSELKKYENLIKFLIMINKKNNKIKENNNKNKYLFVGFGLSLVLILYCFHRRNKHMKEMILLKIAAKKQLEEMKINSTLQKYNLIYNGFIKIIDIVQALLKGPNLEIAKTFFYNLS